MTKPWIRAAAITFLALGGWSEASRADTAEAMCEVRKEGETKKGASGPCDFSQRQGYVSLNLRNGDRYELAPTNRPEHYKDPKGNKVVRYTEAGGAEVFKWESGKKIFVTFVSSGGAHRPAQASYTAGATVPDLADLVGAKGGQAEGELQRRGYAYARGSTSGSAKFSAWYNASTGRCAMIRTEEGRYQSIVQAPPLDCGR